MSFFARVYVSVSIIAVHSASKPINIFVIDRMGLDVFDVEFAGEYMTSADLMPVLTFDNMVISSGPEIIAQAQI